MDMSNSSMDMGNGTMDHSTMDNSTNSTSGHHGGPAGAVFYFSSISTILFKGLNTDAPGELFGAFIVTFAVSFLYEGLRKVREKVENKQRQLDQLHAATQHKVTAAYNTSTEEIHVPSKDSPEREAGQEKTQTATQRHLQHALVSTLHMTTLAISYLIMLVVMTFNVWLFIAAILGAGLGHWFFTIIVKIEYQKCTNAVIPGHCNT